MHIVFIPLVVTRPHSYYYPTTNARLELHWCAAFCAVRSAIASICRARQTARIRAKRGVLRHLWKETYIEKNTFCLPRQYLQESDGRVCHEKSGEKGCSGAFVSHLLSCYQSGRNRQSGLSTCPEETGGAWNLLYRPRCPAVDQLRLCRLRFADRHGPGQCPQYATHILRRPSGKDPSVDGVCWPTVPRGCRSMVHQGLRGHLERCVGGLSRVAWVSRKATEDWLSASYQIPLLKVDASCHSSKRIAIDREIVRMVSFN